MITAVIFDIDGTLLDSVDLHARAWQHAFHDFGHQIDFIDIRRQIGKGGDKIIPFYLTPEQDRDYGERLNKYRSELFKREYMPQVKPFPKVRELFERIRRDGKQIALASSAKGDELEAYKRIANISDLVDEHTSSDDVEHSKPSPDIFAAALEKLGNPDPKNAVAVGDTPYDLQAAAQIGLPGIAMLCGGFPENDLRAAGCIAVFRDPADLLEHYEQSPLAARRAA